MSKIINLSEELRNQIAAGEVVERPASVVKELVENALDANASFVAIEIVKGGQEKMVVRDNGEGMVPADAKLAIKRYTTSKIESVEDLTNIKTFGFRGEALSSIAAVAKVSLKTKTKEAVEGTEVVVEGGKTDNISSCAHPVGTTVTVADLFFNLPVRKKFLKSPSWEFNLIKKFCLAQALACPQVGFKLSHNQKEIYNFPEGQTWEDRLKLALKEDFDKFVPVSLQADYVAIRGYIGLPQIARQRRVNQFLFVNHRCLYNKSVWAAVREAYRGVLPYGMYPQYVLDLTIREDLLDVNIHPRKEEVRFITASVVYDAVVNVVRSALSKQVERNEVSLPRVSSTPSGVLPTKPIRPQAGRTGLSEFDSVLPKQQESFAKEYMDFGRAEEGPTSIFQLAQLYIVVPLYNEVVIYDQHAADERVLLEQLLQDYKLQQTNGLGQELLFSVGIGLGDNEYRALQGQVENLHKLGFRFNFLDDNQVEVESVPTILKQRDIKKILLGLIDDFITQTEELELDNLSKPRGLKIDRETLRSITYLACRSAIKQGDQLTASQMRALVQAIDGLKERGLTCPHGRPTYIRLSPAELDRMFKRRSRV